MLGQVAGSCVVVDRVERGGRDPDQHLPGAGNGPVHVLEAQDLGGLTPERQAFRQRIRLAAVERFAIMRELRRALRAVQDRSDLIDRCIVGTGLRYTA